ncbi:hypothetical protein N9F34_05765 [Alphaproteobacteria bacterium]|nr:hypothetical protein [Alphaproteobacteria bacterium]
MLKQPCQAGYSPTSARASAYHYRRSPAVATLIEAAKGDRRQSV